MDRKRHGLKGVPRGGATSLPTGKHSAPRLGYCQRSLYPCRVFTACRPPTPMANGDGGGSPGTRNRLAKSTATVCSEFAKGRLETSSEGRFGEERAFQLLIVIRRRRPMMRGAHWEGSALC